jgi:hypothetical protein
MQLYYIQQLATNHSSPIPRPHLRKPGPKPEAISEPEPEQPAAAATVATITDERAVLRDELLMQYNRTASSARVCIFS